MHINIILNSDAKDTQPLLPSSAILCNSGELIGPVPSSRMSPFVENPATVKRRLGEPSLSEIIFAALENAEPFLSKSPFISKVHSVDFLSTITCLPAIVGWLDSLELTITDQFSRTGSTCFSANPEARHPPPQVPLHEQPQARHSRQVWEQLLLSSWQVWSLRGQVPKS